MNPQESPHETEIALEAIKTLLTWIGEDPSRQGLQKTPQRVLKSWMEMFAGYQQNPEQVINDTFTEVNGYNGVVILRDIEFLSHCEHHLAPFIGKAHVAYLPDNRIVGISKIARLVDIYAKRLQTQEKMTAQIATMLHQCLQPLGVVAMIEAEHACLRHRGIKSRGSVLLTIHSTGIFEKDSKAHQDIVNMLRHS